MRICELTAKRFASLMKPHWSIACRHRAGKASWIPTSRQLRDFTARCLTRFGWRAKHNWNFVNSVYRPRRLRDSPRMYPTDLTVAAVVEHDNKYLLVEERAMG